MGKHRQLLLLCLMGLLLARPLPAWAGPRIEVTMSSALEVTEMVDGRESKKMVAAEVIEPGQVLQFTIVCTNLGDEAASNVVINNPVPAGAVYEMGSAGGADSEILFSIDGGKNYMQPSLLTYEIDGEDGKPRQKIASPEQYTDIRWTIKEVAAGGKIEVSFRVKIK